MGRWKSNIGKRAILLTLGITFVSLTILGLATLVLKNAQSSDERFLELASAERLYNIESSAGTAIQKIVVNNAGFRFNINSSTVSFTKELFNHTDSNIDVAGEAYTSLKKILDQRYSSTLDASKFLAGKTGGVFTTLYNTIIMELLPFGKDFRYEYSLYPGNIIYVSYKDTVVSSLTVVVNSTVGNGTIYENPAYSCAYSLPTCMPINITTFGPGGHVQTLSSNVNLNALTVNDVALSFQHQFNISNLSVGTNMGFQGGVGITGIKAGGVNKQPAVIIYDNLDTVINLFKMSTSETVTVQVTAQTTATSPLKVISVPALRITLPFNEFLLLGKPMVFAE